MKTALENVRVLDMSRVLAGPWAGQLLGDYGADVIKLERPSCGDDTRHWGPPWLGNKQDGMSAYFLSANRNKRSITVDLSTRDGQSLALELCKQADVLIENFRVGTMAGFGLGYEQLRATNPGLIYCSISAFGQTGQRANEPGYDAMIQGAAGLMSVTGAAGDGGPQKVGIAIADIMAGMYATTAILAALNTRTRSGEGQHIDVPLYDSQIAWLANQGMNYLVNGQVPGRMGTAHPNLVPYQAFATSDGDIIIAVGNDSQFRRCCDALALTELATEARFATNANRVRNRAQLVELLQSRLLQASTEEWMLKLRNADVPCGPVQDIGQALNSDQAQERQLVRHFHNFEGPDIPTLANPVALQETPVTYSKAPPKLGEHNDEVLSDWLGYSADKINALRNNDTI